MSFGVFKKLKFKPFIVGMPNPKSVSKEEWERRSQHIKEINAKLREKYNPQ